MSYSAYSSRIFVGRENARKYLDWVLENEGFLVVSGPGGIGKTQLLNHFIESLAEKTKQNSESMVLFTRQPIDLSIVANRREIGLLKTLAQEIEPRLFANFTDSISTFHENINQARRSFRQCLEEAPYERLILFFDTFEQTSQEVKMFFEFLLDVIPSSMKIAVVIAGRPGDEHNELEFFAQLQERSSYKLKLEKLPLKGLEQAEISEYFKVFKIDVSGRFISRLYELTEGRPILIALTVDWLQYGNITEDLVNNTALNKRHFQRVLVEQISALESPVDDVILAMAHFSRRCDATFIKTILGEILRAAPEEIFASLQDFSFVKYRPATYPASENWTLHDEMRKFVTEYIWSRMDPWRDKRREWTRRAIDYYDELLRRETDLLEKQNLERERLYYLRFVSKAEAQSYRKRLWVKTRSASARWAIVDTLREYDAAFGLEEDERNQLDLDTATLQYQETAYTKAIKFFQIQHEKAENDIPRLAELRSRLIFSYANAGELDQGEDLASDSIKWIDNELNADLTSEVRNDFLRRKSLFLNAIGYVYRLRGDTARAVYYYNRSLNTIPNTREYDADRTATKINLSYVLHMMGDDGRAIAHAQSALRLGKSRNDLYRCGLAHNVLGTIEANSLREPEAERHFTRAIEYFRNAESNRGLAMATVAFARMRRQLGWHRINPQRDVESPGYLSLEEAKQQVMHALSLIEEGNHIIRIDAHSEMGAICREQHKFHEAIAEFRESIKLAREIDNSYAEGEAYHGMALTYFLDKDFEHAREYSEEALSLGRKIQSPYILGRAQRTLANIAWHSGDFEQSFRLAIESFLNIMEVDKHSLSDSAAKKAMFQQEWMDWILGELVVGKEATLAPEEIVYNCDRLTGFWNGTYSGRHSLADSYPGLAIRLEDIKYEYASNETDHDAGE